MKVLGAGYARTGTLSLKIALEKLGFDPCYHMETVIKNPGQVPLWQAVVDGKTPDWNGIFGGYQSATDMPPCLYYKELLEHYPGLKVILTVRDPERWYRSTYDTIYKFHLVPHWRRPFIPPLKKILYLSDKMIFNGAFEGQMENKKRMIEIFNEHKDDVMAAVPPDQLLIFQVKEGWQPLCDFLGVPVPKSIPFPMRMTEK